MKVYISLRIPGGKHKPFWFITKYRRSSSGNQYLHSNGDWCGSTGTDEKPTGRFETLKEAEKIAIGFGYELITG